MAQLFAPTPPEMSSDPIMTPLICNTRTVSAVVPSSHPITMPRLLEVSDFDKCEEGNILWANVRRLRTFLERGFDNPNNPSQTPRETWLLVGTDRYRPAGCPPPRDPPFPRH